MQVKISVIIVIYSKNNSSSIESINSKLLLLISRYPKVVMELIEELSYGIAQPFRDQQKDRIKRTFVSGSDAAEARLKRGNFNLLYHRRSPSI